MKDDRKDVNSLLWIQTIKVPGSSSRIFFLPKFMVFFITIIFFTTVFYSIKISCPTYIYAPKINEIFKPLSQSENHESLVQNSNRTNNLEKTQLHHIVFGIAASSKLWEQRKNYVKLWWRPDKMRGFVWLDKPVKNYRKNDSSLPTLKISSDTSKFKYRNKEGDRSAIRLSRIVSETFRLGLNDVRWFVMGDDDTFFVADNLVRVLAKYDHNQFYYIGSSSESHMQNIVFSYNMAYGGGGFAISYPLAKALAKIQDRCIRRYPSLYGSDDRIQACMAELGVPLTKEIGFHQFDLYGTVFGLLAAHPVAPLVSLHHLDIIDPIFPNVDQLEALQRLKVPMKLDSAGLVQQSICYDKRRNWSISVSWGYAVQIYRGILSARVMERPARTFVNWYKKTEPNGFSFNTRPWIANDCQKPYVFVLSNALFNPKTNMTASEYVQFRIRESKCKWKMANPSEILKVEVYKKPDPYQWDKAPRRNCCRVLPTEKKGTVVLDVGECREGEIVELS